MVRSTKLALALFSSVYLYRHTAEALLLPAVDTMLLEDLITEESVSTHDGDGKARNGGTSLAQLDSQDPEKTSARHDDDDGEERNGDASPAVTCDALTHVPSDVTALYINLDSRKDRKERFLRDTREFLEPFERCKGWTLNRFKATDANSLVETKGEKTRHSGQVAAATSHVAALKHAGNSSKGPVLIFEDDYSFKGTPASLVQRLDKAFEGLGNTWDVVMMGANEHHPNNDDSGEHLHKYGIGRTKGAWCSEAYMVKKEYVPRLLDTTSSGLTLLEQGTKYVHSEVEPLGAAYDTLWYPLQKDPNSTWVVFSPKIGEQKNTWGDSDID